MVPIRYNNFDGLLNSNASDFVMKDNELVACKNVYVNRVGRLEKVPGYSKSVNDTIVTSKTVNYLHYYFRPSTGTNYLIGASDSGSNYILEYRTTGNWTTLSATYSSRAGAEVSMTNYLDKVFIVGHDSGTFLSPASISGTTYTTNTGSDTDLLNMPKAKYIERFRDLLYVANVDESGTKYPNRVYYCDEPTGGAITWTVATGFSEFGYDDGDEITGISTALDRLVVFKHYSMWTWDESSRREIAPIGCDSYRSIVNVANSLYWFNRNGFWRWTGGYPELVSSKAQPFIDAIVQANLGDVVAGVYDGFEYRAFIGTVTVDDITYTNAWWCFDIRSETEYIRCTAESAGSVAEYVESSIKRTYFGGSSGFVYKFATDIDGVYSDNGNDIDSFFITKSFDHGVPEDKKFTNHLTIFSTNIQGMRIFVEADNKGQFDASQSQVVRRNVEILDIAAEAYRYRYKFAEKGQGKSWTFDGFIVETQTKEKDQ